jgi:penicillin-binding protein 1A
MQRSRRPTEDRAFSARGGRRWWPIVKWGLVFAIWSGVALSGLLTWYFLTLPDVDDALTPTRRPAVTIVSADGAEIATVGDNFARPVTVAELPAAVPDAVISIEDRRFYDHFGLDVFGLARAAWANVRAGGIVQGGSTITQQAAKTLFLTPERTLKRKVQELMLALWLEHKFSKDQILSIYLNRIYYGAGTYGIDAAARKFFNKPAARLSTYEAAMLAGILKAPSRLNPLANPGLAEQRARVVLASMVAAGRISEAEAQAAIRSQAAGGGRGRRPNGMYFVDWVLAQLPAFVTARDQDLRIVTTLDARAQRIAEDQVEKALSAAAASGGPSQAALVAMAPDGAVRALVGGRDYALSPFNRATQAYRQPGSAFKPIVYLAGLEAGLTPASRFVDKPLQVAGWEPRNYSGRFQGEMSLRQALAQSVNTIAVRVSEYAGRERVIATARRIGITANLEPTPSLALGVSEISLLELTAAYATIGNGGFGVWPYGIQQIEDGDGHLLYTRTGSGPGRVIAAADAADLTGMLAEVVTTGTGKAAQMSRPAAGKTGTSQNARDAWFIGFTADLVAGVWMGNDDERPMTAVTGGGPPARLWKGFMTAALAGSPERPLRVRTPEPRPAPQLPAAALDQPTADEPGFFRRLLRVFSSG